MVGGNKWIDQVSALLVWQHSMFIGKCGKFAGKLSPRSGSQLADNEITRSLPP